MLSYFFFGYRLLSIPMSHASQFLELCRSYGFIYDQFNTDGESCINLRMREKTAQKVLLLCESQDLPIEVITAGGLPKLCHRLVRRPGLLVGFLIACFLMWFSSGFVWDVRVSGNHLLTEREVEETLRSCGFGVGSSLRGFKADRTENKALIKDSRLSWISVNMKGTVAYVEIREAMPPPENTANIPANVIAAMGGQIVHVELEQGNVVVASGKWVDEGDLLISGLYDSEQMGFRYTHAKGRVFARVTEQITVTVPLTYEKKVYQTDNTQMVCEKSLNFFENYIKFSKKTGNITESCDIIKRVSVPFTEWGVDFPISLVTEWYVPFIWEKGKYSYEEAEALAYYELSKRISEIPGGAQLLNKQITTACGETCFVLTCTLDCIRDIAKEQIFEVLP